jgi:hypothetical protein
MKSTEGSVWTEIEQLDISGLPSEATVRVLADGKLHALIRREGGFSGPHYAKAVCGIGRFDQNKPQRIHWHWHYCPYRMGGPTFIQLPDGRVVSGFRLLAKDSAGKFTGRMVLALTPKSSKSTDSPRIDKSRITLELPSGGDCSYPGLVYLNESLFVSYYSSHEGKTAIYLAKVEI